MTESSQIRTLLLSLQLDLGGAFELEKDLCEPVRRAATKANIYTPSVGAEKLTDADFKKKVVNVVWDLITEGIFAPFEEMGEFTFRRLRLTDQGKHCYRQGVITPHDPDRYLERITKECPNIDDVTIKYLAEAAATYRSRNHFASVVMLGVAAENILRRLRDAIEEAISDSVEKDSFSRATNTEKAYQLHKELMNKLGPVVEAIHPTTSSFRVEKKNMMNEYLSNLFQVLRRSRNDAGHPSGRPIPMEENQELLILFPKYCKAAHDVMAWLVNNHLALEG